MPGKRSCVPLCLVLLSLAAVVLLAVLAPENSAAAEYPAIPQIARLNSCDSATEISTIDCETAAAPRGRPEAGFLHTGFVLSYTVSGLVQDEQSDPIAGATIWAGAGMSATTEASGVYTITELLSGTYTLTPTMEGWIFDPVTRTVSVPPDAAGQDFTGFPACPSPLLTAGIDGPILGFTDTLYTFTAVVSPANATEPISYTWSPAPEHGQATASAGYRWITSGTYSITLDAANCGATVSGTLSVDIVVPQATVMIDPGTGGTLIYTDTQGNRLEIEVAGGAVTETITLLYFTLDNASPPPGFSFAGHAFLLEASGNGAWLPGFVFEPPMTVTIEYSDADVAGLDEATLELRYWNGNEWSTEGIVVLTRDLANNRLVVTVAHLSPFAMFGQEEYKWYLPIVLKNLVTPAACSEGIANGGFETTSAWERPVTVYRAAYSTAKAHTGNRSMRVGIVNPADNVYSYSSARQRVTIPAGVDSATLRFWLYPISGELGTLSVPPRPLAASPEEALLASDAQYVLILNESDVWIDTVLWQRRNDQAWTYHEADLSDYAGRTIKLHFGVYNDGSSGATGMYVDDASLVICSP